MRTLLKLFIGSYVKFMKKNPQKCDISISYKNELWSIMWHKVTEIFKTTHSSFCVCRYGKIIEAFVAFDTRAEKETK